MHQGVNEEAGHSQVPEGRGSHAFDTSSTPVPDYKASKETKEEVCLDERLAIAKSAQLTYSCSAECFRQYEKLSSW
jgi:hypothetical protein